MFAKCGKQKLGVEAVTYVKSNLTTLSGENIGSNFTFSEHMDTITKLATYYHANMLTNFSIWTNLPRKILPNQLLLMNKCI